MKKTALERGANERKKKKKNQPCEMSKTRHEKKGKYHETINTA